jgi:DNA-binding CsgD family transcriptional regulator
LEIIGSPRIAELRRFKSNKEIGVQLFITEGTVKTYMKNLFEKLGVVGRTAAIREAVNRGLIRLN